MTTTTIARPRATQPPAPSLFDRSHRSTTVGVLLVVSVVALEAMAVATVMPQVSRDLHGMSVYGWAFTAFFLGDVTAMAVTGGLADRRGPRWPLVGGLGLFAAGLAGAAAAPTMALFVTARALQGIGGGSIVIAVWVVIARAYPSQLRPRAFSALSAAWILPALAGPVGAGLVAGTVGWRWTFAALVPLTVAGGLLLAPTLRRIPPAAAPRDGKRVDLVLGLRLAGGLAVTQAASRTHAPWGALLAVVGILLVLTPLARLLPAGALRWRAGLPALVSARGVLSAVFEGVAVFVPLSLTRLHQVDTALAGLPLTAGAIGWSAASWWQGRLDPAAATRTRLVVGGLLMLSAGSALIGCLSWTSGPTALVSAGAVAGWTVAGAGMGLASPSISVLTMAQAGDARQGAVAAGLQISDVVGGIAGITLASALLAALGEAHLAPAVLLADLTLAAVAAAGALALSRRTDPRR